MLSTDCHGNWLRTTSHGSSNLESKIVRFFFPPWPLSLPSVSPWSRSRLWKAREPQEVRTSPVCDAVGSLSKWWSLVLTSSPASSSPPGRSCRGRLLGSADAEGAVRRRGAGQLQNKGVATNLLGQTCKNSFEILRLPTISLGANNGHFIYAGVNVKLVFGNPQSSKLETKLSQLLKLHITAVFCKHLESPKMNLAKNSHHHQLVLVTITTSKFF